jgi:PiT family inorganic phosphate transporter
MDMTAPPWTWIITLAAMLFALVSGTNDGATLLALGVRASRMPLLWATFILTSAVVAAPLFLGTRVAATFIDRLVRFDDQLAVSMLIAVIGALATVAFLGWRGLPTSLTVATLGALVGAGAGRGLEVHWGTVALVVLVALVTPVIGFVIAFLISRLAMQIDVRGQVSGLLEKLHIGAFAIQCLAYGSNDGQKMVAVFFVTGGVSTTSEMMVRPTDMVVIAIFFALGTLLGLRRYARTVVLDVFPIRPASAVAAEMAAAASVLGTGLLGSPVSTTQTVVTSVIGSGSHEGFRRIRWQSVVRIGTAWLYTFPLTFLLGMALSWLSRGIR